MPEQVDADEVGAAGVKQCGPTLLHAFDTRTCTCALTAASNNRDTFFSLAHQDATTCQPLRGLKRLLEEEVGHGVWMIKTKLIERGSCFAVANDTSSLQPLHPTNFPSPIEVDATACTLASTEVPILQWKLPSEAQAAVLVAALVTALL